MIVEPSRMLAKALEHPEWGVNAQLRDLETYPDHDTPREVRVWEWTKDDEAVQSGTVMTDLPSLVITKPAAFEMEGEVTTSKRDTEALGTRIGIAVIMEMAALDSSAGAVEAAYIVTGIVKCLRQWLANANENSRGGSTGEHGYQVRDASSIWWTTDVVKIPESDNIAVGGGVFVDIQVRDINP